MAYSLPFHPCALPRILGSSNAALLANVSIDKNRLPALGRHLSVSHPNLPLNLGQFVDPNNQRRAPRLSFVSLQHFRMKIPFSSLLVPRSVQSGLPATLKVPYSGFGYPRYGVSTFHPWESLSTPNTLGIRPSKLSSFSVVETLSRVFLSAPALSYKTSSGLVPTLQRVTPTEKAVPLYCPRRTSSGRSRLLSWALGPLGLSKLLAWIKSISLSIAPSRP
jgi:hypothetical protein